MEYEKYNKKESELKPEEKILMKIADENATCWRLAIGSPESDSYQQLRGGEWAQNRYTTQDFSAQQIKLILNKIRPDNWILENNRQILQSIY